MKTCLRSFLAVLLLIVSADIQAQIRTGKVVGFNLSTMALNSDGVDVSAERSTGIHFGMTFPLAVNDYFTAEPGVQFTSKGSSYKIDTVDISISPIYIEVPLNLTLTFGSDAVGVTFIAGTYFSYGIGGIKIESGGEAQEINFGSGDTKDLKHFDLGVNFGAGVNIKGFLISAQYGLGLANLSPEASVYTEMKNRVLGISLTSSFTGK
jgi:hypothetical protein